MNDYVVQSGDVEFRETKMGQLVEGVSVSEIDLRLRKVFRRILALVTAGSKAARCCR